MGYPAAAEPGDELQLVLLPEAPAPAPGALPPPPPLAYGGARDEVGTAGGTDAGKGGPPADKASNDSPGDAPAAGPAGPAGGGGDGEEAIAA